MLDPLFDDLTDAYEAVIDWPKRLAREEPFYRRLFAESNVQSVVDTACGTGRHAALFHSWGLRVEGADLSPRMIQRCRRDFGEPEGLHWTVRGFDEPITSGPWDAALCVGNSLALAPDRATVQRAVAAMSDAVSAGGLLLVQVLNLWPLADGPCVWQKCRRTTLPQGEVLILKGVHRSGNRGYVEFVVTDLAGGVRMQAESIPFLGLEAADLQQMVLDAGFRQVSLRGGCGDPPYQRPSSVDLVVVARK